MLYQLSWKLKSQHLLILIALIILAIIVTAIHDQTEYSVDRIQHPLTLPIVHSSNKVINAVDYTSNIKVDTQLSTTSSPTWHTVVVKSGDTISRIFSKLNINPKDLAAILSLTIAKEHLNNIKPGQNLLFLFNKSNQLEQLKYAFNDVSTLLIEKKATKFTAKIVNKPLESRLIFKEITIHGSLAASAQRVGVASTVYSQLKGIFNKSLNFGTSVRNGDHFNLLYEEFYVNGKRYKLGKVMLANFQGHQHNLTAIRYTDPKGQSNYYTPKGYGLQAMFLPTPVHYKYISSYFSLRRLDPYIHKYHPHLGVDFAAPAGTPVHSIGDGVIAFRGWDNGYGNAVIVKYGSTYKALYGHMARFASNLKVGQDVSKGQVIGYVGSTGWATGDHLHFGWFINNIPRDPLKYAVAATAPIPDQYRNTFIRKSKTLMAQLELYKSTQFAENKTETHNRHS